MSASKLFGKDILITSTTNASGTTIGSISTLGGMNVNQTMLVSGALTSTADSNTIGNLFTTGGNVGFGTTAPVQRLDVNGNLNITGNFYQNGSVYSGSTQWGSTGANIYFNTGNVGIGTLSPTAKLQVDGEVNLNIMSGFNTSGLVTLGRADGVNRNSAIKVYNSTGGNSYMSFEVHNGTGGSRSTSILMDGFGNVGIGTTTPSSKLHLRDNGSVTLLIEADSDNVTETDVATLQFRQDGGLTGMDVGMDVFNNSYVKFNTGTTKGSDFTIYDDSISRMHINSSGNVGIGTTSPAYTLDINGTFRTNNINYLTSTTSIQATTNNYSVTSGALNVTGDIVLPGSSEIYFTNTGSGAPTLNGRGSGSKIILWPSTNVTQGDFSIGIENLNTWFQVPNNSTGYKFYQGTSANLVIASAGNIGIGTTSPNTLIHLHNTSLPKLTLSRYTVNTSGGNLNHGELVWKSLNRGNDNAIIRCTSQSGPSLLGWDDSGRLEFLTQTGAQVPSIRMVITENGNIGIGTTNPNTALDLVTLNNNGGLRVAPTVTGAEASIGFYSNPSFGINSGTGGCWVVGYATGGMGTGNFGIYNSTLNRAALGITNSGNVGIGTTNPATALHVIQPSGTASMSIQNSSSTGNSSIDFFNQSSGYIGAIGFGNTSSSSGGAFRNTLFLYHNNQDAVFIGSGTTERMRITASGNVGIGNSAPNISLDFGTNYGNQQIALANISSGIWGFGAKNDAVQYLVGNVGVGSHVFYTGTTRGSSNAALGTERMRITGTGNIGIGTSSPISTFQVNGTSRFVTNSFNHITIEGGGDDCQINWRNRFNNTDTICAQIYMDGYNGGDEQSGIFYFRTANAGVLNNNALTIAKNGYVGIGLTTASYPLQVSGSANTGNVGSYAGYYANYAWQNQTAVYATSIYTSHFIVAGQGFASLSDARIKKDIIDLDDTEALIKLRAIQPKKYKYKDYYTRGASEIYGFIAQQVEEVMPYATGTTTDYIPNIMKKCNLQVNEDNVCIITIKDNESHGITSPTNIKIKLFTETDYEIITIKEIINDYTISINEPLAPREYFMYGIEVDDFKILNKDAIFTTSVAAIQQLDRELQETKQELSSAQNTINQLVSFIQSKYPNEFQI